MIGYMEIVRTTRNGGVRETMCNLSNNQAHQFLAGLVGGKIHREGGSNPNLNNETIFMGLVKVHDTSCLDEKAKKRKRTTP